MINLIPSKEFKYCDFEFIDFNPLQSETFKYFVEDCNLVVAGHVCAGKTVIHEAISSYELSKDQKGKVVYVSPIRALANEKIEEWKKHSTFGKYNLIELTSDNDVSMLELCCSRIIVATIEALNICCRRGDDWIKDIRLLTFDEAHLFDHEKRGAGAEALMMNVSSFVNCRFLLLSGTMGNVKDLAKWVKVLNGKKTFFVDSDWRPTKLKKEIVCCENGKENFDFIKKTIDENYDDKILIFVHSKKTGRDLYEKLKTEGIKSCFYCSDIPFEKRKEILDDFRSSNGYIRVLIGTNALSMGVSL